MKRDFQYISTLQSKAKERYKPVIIKVEILAKRTLRKIDGISREENARTQVTDLFSNFYREDTFMQFRLLRCLDSYSRNKHLDAFRKFMKSLLNIMDETIS